MSIQIWYKTKTVGRDEYLDFYTERIPGGRYGEGGFQTAHTFKSGSREEYYDNESAKKTAAQKAADYLGVPIWEISGYEYLKPSDVAPDAGLQAIAQREAEQQAITGALHARREALRQGYSGKFSETALKDVTIDLGEYLPSYIQNLPQEKAESMIKEGKIGGWQVDNRFFRTEQEANEYIKKGVIVPPVVAGQGKPWMPEAYAQLQVTKDLKNKFEEQYEPYTTIEGTTLYKSKLSQPESVTIPRFGKMIPAKEDPANKFISENFEKGERFVSDRLMLHEILNPVIKAVELYKPAKYTPTFSHFTGQEWKDASIGALKGVRDKPLTIAGNVALAILITKGTGTLVSKVPALAAGMGKGAVASRISAINILGAGLAAVYAGDVGVRYSKAPNKAEFAGGVLATELIPFGVGGYIGTKPLRIKSNINEVIKILQSQKKPFKAFLADESAVLRKTKWQQEAGKPERKEISSAGSDAKKATDVFNYFSGREPPKPFEGMGKGGLGEFKSPSDRILEQMRQTGGTGRESFLEYQNRVVSGILKPKPSAPESFIATPRMIPKAKVILKATKIKTDNMSALVKLWEERGLTAKEGQVVLTKQKTVQITKQEVKTAQIQATKETIKVIEKPKTGVYALAYVSAASRLINRLKENTLTANAIILREQARTKPQTFVSETAKAIERVKERTKAMVSERARVVEKEQVRERVREKAKEKQRTRTLEKTKMRVPEKLVKLGLPRFSQEISRIAKKRKNRDKYIWDVNNPVPILEQILG